MSRPKIESYHFGHLAADGRSYDADVIVLPDGVVAGWWRKEGHALHVEDLEVVFDACPEVLIVGQGANGLMRITDEASQALQRAGIELIAQPTEEACRTYNDLRQQKQVAAALHLTC